jgi:hypothetical protein
MDGGGGKGRGTHRFAVNEHKNKGARSKPKPTSSTLIFAMKTAQFYTCLFNISTKAEAGAGASDRQNLGFKVCYLNNNMSSSF